MNGETGVSGGKISSMIDPLVATRKTKQQIFEEMGCDGKSCLLHLIPQERVARILGLTRERLAGLGLAVGHAGRINCQHLRAHVNKLQEMPRALAVAPPPPRPRPEIPSRVPDPRFERTWDYVYLFQWQAIYKIGCSKDPKMRLSGINQGRFPLVEPARLLHQVHTQDALLLERHLHCRFDAYRCVRPWREWFTLPDVDVQWICNLRDWELDESPSED